MKVKAELSDFESSSVKRVEYTTSTDPNDPTGPECGWMRVTFANGSRYMYKDVSFGVFCRIAAADSIGHAVHENLVIQPYEYAKV